MKVRKLMMTESEICSSYRRSENKIQQINILCELNACKKIELLATLQNGNADIEFLRNKMPEQFAIIEEIERELDLQKKLAYVYGK